MSNVTIIVWKHTEVDFFPENRGQLTFSLGSFLYRIIMEFLHSYSIILGLKPQNSVNISLFSTFSVKSLSTINTQYSIHCLSF